MTLLEFRTAMELVGVAFDGVGVFVIAAGGIIATARFAARGLTNVRVTYRGFRQELGGAIVLGLEFLIAGDIIRTVAVAPTLENVLVLGVIVVIRTFLSMTLQLELEGRWPWQRATTDEGARHA